MTSVPERSLAHSSAMSFALERQLGQTPIAPTTMQFLASGTHTTGVSFYNALLWQQIRFASKRPLKPKIRGTPHTKHVPRPVAPTKLDRPPPTPSTSAASTANGQAVATSAENAAGAVGRSVQLVEERIEYLYKGEKMPNPRVIWAVGLAMFVVVSNCAHSAWECTSGTADALLGRLWLTSLSTLRTSSGGRFGSR